MTASRPAAVLALLGAVLLAGCSSSTTPRRTPPPSSSAASTQSVPQRCGAVSDSGGGHMVSLHTSDGVRLDAAEVGSGAAGVVLLHEYPADLCGFYPYAVYLSRHGLHVLDLDMRCFGSAACPGSAAARAALPKDVAAGVAELSRRGARHVAVLGASMGGTVALAAAAQLGPAVAAVVCLSCHSAFTPVVGGTPVPLDVATAVPRIRCPALFVVGSDDPRVRPGEVRGLYRHTAARDKHLQVITGAMSAQHGWELLASSPGQWTSVAAGIAAFLTRTTS